MKDPLREYSANLADLHKIPLFNPRFRQVYGPAAIVAIFIMATAVFALGLRWLAPWNPYYTLDERTRIWCGVVVMPFAGLLVASYSVEFVVKSAHVLLWFVRRQLVFHLRTLVFGLIALILLLSGIVLAKFAREADLYGYLMIGLSLPFFYWFMAFAWSETDAARQTK